MKAKNNNLKIILAILVIVLISLISFVGIFVKDNYKMKNIIPEYDLGIDFEGGRTFSIKPDETVNTEYYDKDGKKVEKSSIEEGKESEYTKKEVPVNNKDILNDENYEKVKNIVQARLELLGVSDYEVRKNSANGEINVIIPESNYTDSIISQMTIGGNFEISDAEDTSNVLIKGNEIKDVQVGYGTTENGQVAVYMNIEFNKEGTKKFSEITKTYVKTKDSEGKETEKKVSIRLDNEELFATSFDKEITNGILQLSMGSASTNATSEQLQDSLIQASNFAAVLKTESMPVTYVLNTNLFVESELTEDLLNTLLIVGLIVAGIIAVFTIIKYKKLGLFSVISMVGFVATLLIALRFTNVTITITGLGAGILSIIMNYIYEINILKTKKEDKKAFKKVSFKFIGIYLPCLVVSIVFSFMNFLPIASFGMVLFWGILTMIIYNFMITRLLIDSEENK